MTTHNVDIVVRDRIARSIATSIEGIGIAADDAGLRVERLRQRIRLGNGQFVTATVARPYERVGRSADRARRSVTAFNSASNRGFRNASSGALLLIRQMRNLAAIMAGISAGRGIVNAVDNFQQMRNRIRSVTDSTDQLNATQRRLFEIANEARVPVLGLTTAYQRYDKALSRVGASQEEVFDFTETISKALKVAGSTATETESVLIQLGQALTKGNLDGEELRSLRENAPIEVMEALAGVLGVNVGKLKELGREGRITTSVIRQAVRNLKDGIDQDFAELVPTIGESVQVLANKFTEFIGNSEPFQQVINLISNAILGLANNIPGAIRNVQGLAAAFATFKGVNLLLAGIGAASARVAAGFAAMRTASLSFAGVMAGLRAGAAGLLATLSRLGVIGIAALVGTMVAFRNEIKLAEDGNATLGDAITVEWNLIGEQIKAVTGDAKGNIDKMFSPNSLSEFFQGFTGMLKDIFVGLIALGNNLRVAIQDIFWMVIATIQATWYRVLNIIDKGFTNFLNNIKEGINKVSQFFGQGDALSIDVGFPQREANRNKIIEDIINRDEERSQQYQQSLIDMEEAEKEFDQILTDLFGNRSELYEQQAERRIQAEREAAEKIKQENESLRTAQEAAAQQRARSAIESAQNATQVEIDGANERLKAIFNESRQVQQAFLQTQQGHFNAERAMSEVARQAAIERDRINLIANDALRKREAETSQILRQSWDITSRYIQERTLQFGQVVLNILNQIMGAIRRVLNALGSVAGQIPGASAVGNAIGGAFQRTGTSLGIIGNALGNSELGQGVANAFQPIANMVSNAVTSGVQQGFENAASQQLALEGGGGLRENLQNAIGGIDPLLNPFQQLAEINRLSQESGLNNVGLGNLAEQIRQANVELPQLQSGLDKLVQTGQGEVPGPMG